jgi:hypothetical protein
VATATRQQALRHRAALAALAAGAARQVRRQLFNDTGWAEILGGIALAELRAAQLGIRTVSQRLETPAEVDPAAFAGVSSVGFSIAEPLIAAIDARVAAPVEALPEQWWTPDQVPLFIKQVEQLVAAEVTDAGRSAAQAEMVTQGVTRYVRILAPPSCKRCAVLSGRLYKTSEPFKRHPGCDCTSEPVSSMQDALDRGLLITPEQAFKNGDIRDLTRAEVRAIEDGADIAQVINSSSGIYTATLKDGTRVKATRTGTTRRSAWRRNNPSQTVRLRPEAIYNIAGDDHDKALELLRTNGYLSTTRKGPATQTGGGGGGGGWLPPRRGLLGPHGPDEFPEFNGWRPPAKRSEIDEFTLDQAVVLLDGDGTPGGHGYHRSGLGIKGDEFPAGWEAPDVVDWVHAITDHPTRGIGSKSDFSLFGTSRDVDGVVRLRREYGGKWVIATAHPQSAVRWPR